MGRVIDATNPILLCLLQLRNWFDGSFLLHIFLLVIPVRTLKFVQKIIEFIVTLGVIRNSIFPKFYFSAININFDIASI